MTDYDRVMKFLNRKQRVFSRLDEGIVFKFEWDSLLQEAEQLGLSSSKDQIQGYYDHYRIGEMTGDLNV